MRNKYLIIMMLYSMQRILFALDKPEFSHTRDFFATSFFLTLTSETENTVIRYTIDGSKPSTSTGLVYTTPIQISKTTAVRAITCSKEGSSSDVRTHTFIFLDDVIHQDNSGVPKRQHNQDHVYWTEEFDMRDVSQTEDEIKEALMDIPTISIVTAYDSLFGLPGILRGQNLMEGSGGKAGDPNEPGWREVVECSVEMIYPENEKFREYKNWQENAGIQVQGGGGRWDNGYYDHKQSFTLEFKDQYGAGKLKNDIFSTAPFNSASSPGQFDKIILRAGHNKSWGADWDRENTVYTRDQFGRDLQLLMSGWGSHGTFVHLYLNGKYWGLYNPCERMDDNAMSIYFGGEDDDYFFGKGKGGDQAGSDDRYDYLLQKDWTNVKLPSLAEYLAIDEYIDICLLYCYANPGDGPQYYYGNRNTPPGPMYYTAWDIEDSFEGGSRRTGPPISSDNINFNVYPKIKRNIDFKMKFADRIYKHCFKNGILTDTNAGAVWDSLCTFIKKAILCEIARWGDERGSMYDYNHWRKEWQDVKDDIQGRAGKLVAVLKGAGMYPSVQPPEFRDGNQIISDDFLQTKAYFQLTIQRIGSSGIIYYTINGEDPRSWDLSGNISPMAKQITTQNEIIMITDSSVIKTRSKNGNVWSPLHELIILPELKTNTVSNETNENILNDFLLYQNYPNPFNPSTTIEFALPRKSKVKLEIFDITGRKVAALFDEVKEAGKYSVEFNNSNISAGIYIYKLATPNNLFIRKMLLIK